MTSPVLLSDVSARDLVRSRVGLLEVERIDIDIFRGARTDEPWTRVHCGQMMAQAFAAATLTVEAGRSAHSLHSYFLRPGDPSRPTVYRVHRDRDGQSFSARRLVALQDGEVLLNMAASFQVDEPGLAHALPMPAVAGPEGLAPDRGINLANIDRVPRALRNVIQHPRPIEFRLIEEQDPAWTGQGSARQHHGFRVVAPLPDDATVHRAALVYALNFLLMGARHDARSNLQPGRAVDRQRGAGGADPPARRPKQAGAPR